MHEHERNIVLVNPAISPYDFKSASDVASRIDASIAFLDHDLVLPNATELVVAFGGDGCYRFALDTIQKNHAEDHIVALNVPVGSQNGTAETLKHYGATVTLEEATSVTLYDRVKAVRPATIGKIPFHHGASTHPVSITQAELTNSYRYKMPKKVRAYVAGLVAALVHRNLLNREKAVTLAFTGPFFGPYKILPEQDFFSDTVSIASLRGGQGMVRRVADVLISFALKKPMPKDALHVEVSKRYPVRVGKNREVVVDGEIRTLPKKGIVYIERNSTPIKMAVLTL